MTIKKEVRTALGGKKWLEKATMPPFFQDRIRVTLTFDNPEYTGLALHHQKLLRQMERDGEVPPKKLRFYSESPDAFIVPRGFDTLADEVVVRDERVSVPVDFSDCVPQEELRPIQQQALNAWRTSKKDQGIFVLPTGAGKTILGIELARQLGERTLVLTNRDKVGLKNWQDDALKYVGLTTGVIQADREEIEGRRIVIAMIQTLWSRKELLRQIKGDFGLVVLDECQHSPARTYDIVTGMFPAKYRYGLTATPDRNDNLAPIIYAVNGDIIFEEKMAAEVLPVEVVPVRTGIRRVEIETCDNYAIRLRRITGVRARNEIIVEKVCLEVKGDTEAWGLVGTHRVRHAKWLANRLSDYFGVEQVGLLVSQPNAKDKSKIPVILKEGIDSKQNQVLEKAREGRIKVVVCTYQYVAEGTNIPRWNRLFMATPLKNAVELKQFCGRGRREFEDQDKCLLYDFIDPMPWFLGAWEQRKAHYRKWVKEMAEYQMDKKQGRLL